MVSQEWLIQGPAEVNIILYKMKYNFEKDYIFFYSTILLFFVLF